MSYQDDQERLESDEAPTLGGSEEQGIKSHRSLSGLDSSSDKLVVFSKLALWCMVGGIAWAVLLGVLGGLLYLVERWF